MRLKLGCFNCAIDQAMLSKEVHQKNPSRVIAKAVGEQDLHVVTLCEVGDHKEGLDKSTVRAQDLVSLGASPCIRKHACRPNKRGE